jgi:hypothetical protein
VLFGQELVDPVLVRISLNIVSCQEERCRVATTVIQVGTAHLDTTGLSMMIYARHYRAAGLLCAKRSKKVNGFDPVPYQMLCQALELQLKGFVWFTERLTRAQLKDKYSHRLEALWKDAKAKGIGKYASATPLRDRTIKAIGHYYTKRKFNYLDLDMMFSGYKSIKAEPKAIACLAQLTARLDKSLYHSILSAS